MRGADITQEDLFSCRTLESRIPKQHPLRKLRKVVDLLLATLNDEFDALYARRVLDSIPPERLHRASFLQVLFFIHSERGSWWSYRLQPLVPLVRRFDDG